MKNQLAGLMKQAQAMQQNMERMQEELGKTIVEGQSGAGMVSVLMSCKFYVSRVSIDPALMSDDKEMLEDLVTAAFNDAVRKAEATTQEKMASLSAGLIGCRETAFVSPESGTGAAPFAGNRSEVCTADRISSFAA